MTIYEEIYNNKDTKVAKFYTKLIPNINQNKIIGIKIPNAKKIAKSYANTIEGENFLNNMPHNYLDENTIHGLMLGYLKKDLDFILKYLDKFLPYLDNWATCDTTVSNLKIFRKYPQIIKPKILSWVQSNNDYIKRFGIVCMLTYFLDCYFEETDLNFLSNIKSDNYYVNMALAWYFSVAVVKQKNIAINFLKKKVMVNSWVHNKTIQKCVESFRIDENTKKYLKSLKI